jgi:hypothetical protein
VTKLNRSGSGLVWSTYLGGDGFDEAIGLDVDRHGNVVVTGDTSSPGFPTTPGSFQPAFAGGPTDAFVTKLNAKGSKLLFSTFVGGSGADGAHDGELDKAGSFYIDGFTDSTDFPVTRGAFQTTNAGGFDVFLVKVALGKRHKGSGQRTASPTAQAVGSGARAGLTRDRMTGRR